LKRVVSFDGIELDNKMFISTEFDVDDYIGTRSIAVDGSSVMFVQAKGAFTKEVSIYSKDSGWISTTTKDLLFNSVDTEPKVVVYSDATTDTFYYDHTKVPFKVEPIFEGSEWFTVEFNLIKS